MITENLTIADDNARSLEHF